MAKTPGFGERVRERLRAQGYWNEDKDRPDVIRFSVERGYVHSYVYRWLNGETPRAPMLVKLARDLGVSVEWLVGASASMRRKRRGAAVILAALTLLGASVSTATARGVPSPDAQGASEKQEALRQVRRRPRRGDPSVLTFVNELRSMRIPGFTATNCRMHAVA